MEFCNATEVTSEKTQSMAMSFMLPLDWEKKQCYKIWYFPFTLFKVSKKPAKAIRIGLGEKENGQIEK